jgi:hypothetical protein
MWWFERHNFFPNWWNHCESSNGANAGWVVVTLTL